MKKHRNTISGKREPVRFTFNKAIAPIESDANITSDAGALIVREIIHRLGIDKMVDTLDDPRCSDHIRYLLLELIVHRVQKRVLKAGESSSRAGFFRASVFITFFRCGR